jgi:heme exporter protein B
VLLPAVAVLYHLDVFAVGAQVAAVVALGTVGFAAAGTLFAAMGVRTRAKELVLSVVLFPLTAPALLAGVVACRDLLGGASLAEVADWLRLLLAFDLVFLVGGSLLFGPLTSE